MPSTELQGKTIAVFAAGGAVGAAAARACADRGATVWLSGRTTTAVHDVADEISAAGGVVGGVDAVDATDPGAVDTWVKTVAAAGTIDAVFNAIGGHPAELGYPEPLATLTLDRFTLPLNRILAGTYLTSRAAGLQMAEQGHGSIVTLSATLTVTPAAHMAGITAACGAIEALTFSLAGELGPRGVRVNCVRANAMPETRTIQETGAGQQRIYGELPDFGMPPLGRPVTLADTAGVVAFLASDAAGGMTGQVVTVSAGQFPG